MAANGADAEQASCLANSRHPAFIGDSAPTWLLNQSYSVPDWEGSIPTFTQVLAELDKPQPFSLAAWAAGTGRTTAAPQPDPLRGSAAGPSCSQEARSIADVGRQGKQKIADQPCFQSAEVATPDNCSQSAELSVAVAQGSPVRQPAAAEPQKTVQLLSVLQRQHLRPQPSISASTGKENHGSNGRRATLFSQNTLAGRLKATSSCGYSRAAPLQHAHSSTREDAACRGSTVEGDAVTPGPAGHHEHALGCASSSPGWHNSRVQHDRVRLDGGTTGRSALQHASSVLDEQHGGGLDARRRSMSEPHKSESGGEGGQCDTPYEISRMGNPRSFASSVPAQHASISNAAQSHGVAACQAVLTGARGGEAALPPKQDSNREDARQCPSTPAGVALDVHESCDQECCSNKSRPEEAPPADPELEAMGLRGGSHTVHRDAVLAGEVNTAKPHISRDSSDAEHNLAERKDECSRVNQGVPASSFWRKKRQKMGGVLDLWNRAAQRT